MMMTVLDTEAADLVYRLVTEGGATDALIFIQISFSL